MIYQRTQPAEVVALLLEALRMSIEQDALGPSSRSERRSQPSGGAILEEITPDSAEASSASSSADRASGSPTGAKQTKTSSSSATGSQNGEEASNNSSPSTRSYVNVDYPQAA